MDSYKSGNFYNHPNVKLKLQRNYIMSKNKRKKEVSREQQAEMLPLMMDLRRAIALYDREDLKNLSQLELLKGLKKYSDMGLFFTYFPALKIYLSTEAVLLTEMILSGDKRIVRLGTEQALCCVTQTLENVLNELERDYMRLYEVQAMSGCLRFLFANPNKDVVDWALEHYEDFDLDEVEICDTVRSYQSNKELRDFVLNKINLFME